MCPTLVPLKLITGDQTAQLVNILFTFGETQELLAGCTHYYVSQRSHSVCYTFLHLNTHTNKLHTSATCTCVCVDTQGLIVDKLKQGCIH